MGEVKKSSNPPPWLNESFIENALREGLKDKELKILQYEVTGATALGDHYGSEMFRFNLTVKSAEERKLSIVAKIMPEKTYAEKINAGVLFEMEALAYTKVLPGMSRLMQKAYPGQELPWASCYYTQGPPDQVIILEDLKVDGFTLGNRATGLDMDHTTLVLKTQAHYHACSLLLKDEIKVPSGSLFWSREHGKACKSFLKTPFQAFVKNFKSWPEFKGKEIIHEKLKNMDLMLMEKVFKVWEKDESKTNTFVHGDAWVNNYMFRYDASNKVNGVKMLDLQLISLNSPALDLQYFIFTSVSPKLIFDHIEDFLQIYYETFEETLKRLGHPVPFGFNEFRQDFNEKYMWGFAVFFCFLPLICIPKKEDFNVDDCLNENLTMFEQNYGRPEVREILMRGITFFEEKGVW